MGYMRAGFTSTWRMLTTESLMQNIDWVTFLLKLVLVPIFIGAVSLAGQRWGSTVSGWLIGLPFTSGPVAFFLALEEGDVFASKASVGIMLGIVSVFVFCLAYSRSAIRLGWFQSTLAGFTAFLLSTYLLDTIVLPVSIGLVLALLVLAASFSLMPRVGSGRASVGGMRWELPARMVSATALVFLITGVAQVLGPQLTGLLTPFPIYATTLAVFTHRSQGGEEAVKLLRGVIMGSLTFIFFFLIVSLTIVAWGVGASFLMAIGASFVTHTTSLRLLRLRGRISGSGSH
jgi:hypothetical protein